MASLAVTAHGVFAAIEASARTVLGSTLAGLTVAVQGLGNVGGPLCGLLHKSGARLIVSDLDAERVKVAAGAYGATSCTTEEIFAAESDILAPCALGGVLNPATVPLIRARLVCGGANNQLGSPGAAAESIDDRPEGVLAAVAHIGLITEEIIAEAQISGTTPLAIADARVRSRLAMAQEKRRAP